MVNQQSLIIVFNYGLEDDEPFYELSNRLRELVEESGFGEYDGHGMAIDNSEGSFFMYAPDAKKLYEVIRGTIEKIPFLAGANIRLRFGPSQERANEVNFILNLN
jgi:hypothetical protein